MDWVGETLFKDAPESRDGEGVCMADRESLERVFQGD